MGVVNITPNSFSDGGKFNSPEGLKVRLDQLKDVPIIDLGAESTAPFNTPIGGNLEYRRFCSLQIPQRDWGDKLISIDTYRLQTFRMLQDRFVSPLIFNDVSGKLDTDLSELLQQFPHSPYIFCHNLAPSREETSHHMHYLYRGNERGFVEHLVDYFQRAHKFWRFHHLSNPLIFDPAFGFSKTYQQNWLLLQQMQTLLEQFPPKQCWLIGLSRKSFLRRKAQEKGVGPEQLHRELIQYYRTQFKGYRLIFRLHEPQEFFSL